MNAVFLKVLNMSMAASWLIGAVLVLRLVLKKAPRWIFCLLWAAAAVRLVCPVSFESGLSLVPSAEVLPQEVITGHSFEIRTGIEPVDVPVNEYLADHYYEGITVPMDNGADTLTRVGWIWFAGMLLLGGHAVVSYVRLRRRMETAVLLRDNVYQSENVESPFVMGFFPPKIYLHFAMEPGEMDHVLAHEKAHIARRDHIWKPLGYAVLVLHWFNPLVWLGYSVFCRDIELACDERVIRTLDGPGRAEYTEALVRCSLDRRSLAACPLAFGEVGVKERVKSVLHYRRPAFWAVLAAVLVCIAAAVCFLTDPEPSREFGMRGDHVSDLDPAGIVERILDIEDCADSGNVYMNSDNFQIHLKADFTWDDSQAIRYFFYRDGEIRSSQLRIFPEERSYYVTESSQWVDQGYVFLLRHYLSALKYLPQAQIQALCPGAEGYILHHVRGGSPDDYERVITYTANGAGEIDGLYIHLQLQPLWDGHGTGKDVVELFYGDRSGSGSVTPWFYRTMDQEKTPPATVDAFPGVTFRTDGDMIYAAAADPETGEIGESIILGGMPILDAYFCDITGDGCPEICTTQYWGSGMIDERIVIFDYAKGHSWILQDRGVHDYRLRLSESDGCLYADRRTYRGEELVDFSRIVCREGVLCLENGTEFLSQGYWVTVTVLEVHETYMLVRPVAGSREGTGVFSIPLEEYLRTDLPWPDNTVVISYDGRIRETYPMEFSEPDLRFILKGKMRDLRPMLLVEGLYYAETNRAVPAEIDPGAILGTITSTVDKSEQPIKEGQSNFGCVGCAYARFEDGIVVNIDGEWYYYELLTLKEEGEA